MPEHRPFRYFKTSPEIIRLAVMMYIRFPLSLRNIEDLLHERGIEISHEAVRFWWHRFGPMLAAEIRKRRVGGMRSSNWRWHPNEVFVKINGATHYLWRAVDHESEVLESFVTESRDRKSALKFLKKTLKRHGRVDAIVTDRLRSYCAALRAVGVSDRQQTGRWLNNRAENSLRGPSVHTCHSEGASEPCCGSGKVKVCRNLPLSMPLSRTISTRNARSTVDRISI